MHSGESKENHPQEWGMTNLSNMLHHVNDNFAGKCV